MKSSEPGKAKMPVVDQRSAGGIVYREAGGDVEVALISVGDPPRWQLPKGLIDRGETPEEAALREVREETGLTAELVEPLEAIEYWYVGRYGPGRARFHKIVHFYLMAYREGDVGRHDREVNEARWFPAPEATATLAFAGEKDVMEQALVRIETARRATRATAGPPGPGAPRA